MLSPLTRACGAQALQAAVHLLVLALALVQRATGYMVLAFLAEDGWWTSLSTDAKMCKVLVIHVTFWN